MNNLIGMTVILLSIPALLIMAFFTMVWVFSTVLFFCLLLILSCSKSFVDFLVETKNVFGKGFGKR